MNFIVFTRVLYEKSRKISLDLTPNLKYIYNIFVIYFS